MLKIFQHGRDFAPEFVTGLLVGMEALPSFEVTDCFPFATNLADEVEQEGKKNNFKKFQKLLFCL